MAYDDEDFREVVQTFGKGMLDLGICMQLCFTWMHRLTVPSGIGKYVGIEKMITSCIALEDIVKKGFEELVSCRDQHIKILVTPKRN